MTTTVFLKRCCSLAIAGVLAVQMAPAAEKPARPTYDVIVKRDVMAPMRDGTLLATDLYIPTKDGKPLQNIPAVLMRTPYGKHAWGTGRGMFHFFAKHGYLSATQDVRGCFRSEGNLVWHQQEAKDGYDAIEWLARHPLCNGRVGTHGPSYMCSAQLAAATQTPPSLATMIPHNGVMNTYRQNSHVGGALRLGRLHWFIRAASRNAAVEGRPWAAKVLSDMANQTEFMKWTSRLPWRRGETPLSLVPKYEDWTFKVCFEHVDYDDYWRHPGSARDEHLEAFPKIPILWVTGWLDPYPGGIVEGYRRLAKMGWPNQGLLVGPWMHDSFTASAGDVNFGTEGATVTSYQEFLDFELRWFDRWLKGVEDADTGPAAQFFVMGGGDGKKGSSKRLNHGGHWEKRKSWPPEGTRDTNFYLNANGSLATEPPAVKESSTTYTHDPDNPVSAAGNLWGFWGSTKITVPRGPRDQIELPTVPGQGMPGMPISSRPDVLWYQTAPLKKDLTIAGELRMVALGVVDRAGHRLLRQAVGHPPAKRRLPDRLRHAAFRRRPAGPLPRGLHRPETHGAGQGIPGGSGARAGGQSLSCRASHRGVCVQQQLSRRGYQPQHRRPEGPEINQSRQHRAPRRRPPLAHCAAGVAEEGGLGIRD